MVFQKKGANAAKNEQFKKKGKKAFEVKEEEDDDLDMFDDMDDSDDDDDSEVEETQVQRTPANKGTPKGRQSLSEKKVSFQIPGKNSPAIKTPKKDNNSLIGKKQPTPGSKGKPQVQEFKGIKGNKNQVQKEEEESDDDDDDDDDDLDDLDLELGADDDDDDGDEDDDDDDDEEEDDDEDDDEDEEENGTKGTVQKKLTMLKQKGNEQNKQKTPLKGNDKAKNAPTPKGQTPKSEIKLEKLTPKQKPSQTRVDELERRRQRDSKMLYIGNLPKDVTSEELKVLSSDIQEVVIPNFSRQRPVRATFAFLSFASEAKAEANHTSLQSKKFRGQLLNVDFVGEKSKNKKPAQTEQHKDYNLKKLYVSGLSLDVTISEVAEHFPMSYQITFNQSPTFRSAMIYFSTEEAASKAFEANQEIEIRGQKMVVLHSLTGPRKKTNKRIRGKGKNRNQGGNPAKKMKFAKKEESGEDEE